MTTIETRLERLEGIQLAHGSHYNPAAGLCLLEAAAYLAGEPHTAYPACVCPVLAAFGRAWNDTLDDEARNRILLLFLPRLIGTRSTADVQDVRAFMAADWAVRTYTPAWLHLANLDDDAAALEALPVLSTVESCRAAMPVITAARKNARAAWEAAADATTSVGAWEAAVDAARTTAGGAAEVAAEVAAGEAAVDAARTAAWGGAWGAAVAARETAWGAAAAVAARDAAREKLAPTVALLQTSAAELFTRMIEAQP